MAPIPWTRLRSWFCLACGMCYREYTPILTTVEGIKLSSKFGGAVRPCVRGYLIEKGFDGRCAFQYRSGQMWLCGIQDIKPGACRLWPFKVCKEPTYGRREEAIFKCAYGDLYIYVDPKCNGIQYGFPSREFVSKVILEFIELGLGGSNRQLYTTCRSTSIVTTPTLIASIDDNIIIAPNRV